MPNEFEVTITLRTNTGSEQAGFNELDAINKAMEYGLKELIAQGEYQLSDVAVTRVPIIPGEDDDDNGQDMDDMDDDEEQEQEDDRQEDDDEEEEDRQDMDDDEEQEQEDDEEEQEEDEQQKGQSQSEGGNLTLARRTPIHNN